MNRSQAGIQGSHPQPVNAPDLGRQIIQEWERHLLENLLSRLDQAEIDALAAFAVLDQPFWWGMARDLLSENRAATAPGSPPALNFQALLPHWHHLSLIDHQTTDNLGNSWYRIHPMVCEVVLERQSALQLREFNRLIADYFAAPFVAEARRLLKEQYEGETPAWDGEAEALARHPRGPVYLWTHQTEDMRFAHWSLDRALKWQEHLFQSGQYEAADDIVNATWAVLARWGQAGRAKALLQRDADVLRGHRHASNLANLATLLRQEGQWKIALENYNQAIRVFARLGAKQQLAASLSEISNLHRDLGQHRRAFSEQNAALKIRLALGDQEGQAISLNQLAILYRQRKNFHQALHCNGTAEAFFRKSANQTQLAQVLQTKGGILIALSLHHQALACLQESLEINHRIENQSGLADNLVEMGRVLIHLGEMDRARAVIEESTKIRTKSGGPDLSLNFQVLGLLFERQGDYAAALDHYQQARQVLSHSRHIDVRSLKARIWRVHWLHFYHSVRDRLKQLAARP